MLLLRKDHKGQEKADYIKISHFKISDRKGGLALLVHRRTQKNYFVKVEQWKQGSKEARRMITIREISLEHSHKNSSGGCHDNHNALGREERKGRFCTVEEEEEDNDEGAAIAT